MKIKKIVAALFAVSAVASQLAYATNGDEMMAVGAQSTALGGTGVANFIGAESSWANPAMLGKSKGSEVTGGVNLFTPKVSNTGMPGGSAQDSYEPTSYIPDLSFSSRVNDSWTYGVAVAGIAGMGVDYGTAPASTHMYAKSALSILRVLPTIAYNAQNYGLGLSPIFQSGSLRLSYVNAGGMDPNPTGSSDSSTGFGVSLGGYYNASSALTVAASYQSEIAASYGKQISTAGTYFGLCSPASNTTGCSGQATFGDDLNQPAQIKAGIAYSLSESFTVTADYKLIQWGSAKGYKDFDWSDQTVVAVGAKYAANDYWLGLGYNNSNNPIGTLPASGASAYRNSAINFFNNMFFPAVVTNSYTLGGGYNISKNFAVEAAAVMTPQVTTTVDVASFGGTNTTTHSQQAYELSLRYKF